MASVKKKSLRLDVMIEEDLEKIRQFRKLNPTSASFSYERGSSSQVLAAYIADKYSQKALDMAFEEFFGK